MKNPWLTKFNPQELLVGAFRYYMGRRTITSCGFAQDLANVWPELPSVEKEIIRRELEAEFKKDDEARFRGDKYLPLGHDVDREYWEKVREAWGNGRLVPLGNVKITVEEK